MYESVGMTRQMVPRVCCLKKTHNKNLTYDFNRNTNIIIINKNVYRDTMQIIPSKYKNHISLYFFVANVVVVVVNSLTRRNHDFTKNVLFSSSNWFKFFFYVSLLFVYL